MKIERRHIPIKDLILGYADKGNDGVVGYGGKLDIRPPYQREFVYTPDKQEAVIDSVISGFPLGIMYLVDREDETFEVLDGQQRIISICKFSNRDFSIKDSNNDPRYFDGLTEDQQKVFLDYEIDVYICKGTEQEKLNWFRRINFIGEPLSAQELRNASYTGPWLSSAKEYFSKDGAPSINYSQYISGKRNRQDWLQKAIEWASHDKYGKVNIEQYMADYQRDINADDLWKHFFRTINWVKMLFLEYRSEMKGVEWGILYNQYRQDSTDLNQGDIEVEVASLMMDDEVGSKKGVYPYIFSRNERLLNLRSFTKQQRRQAYEIQKGICKACQGHYKITEMEADHITPWSKGGKTQVDNLQMLCADCNRRKSGT